VGTIATLIDTLGGGERREKEGGERRREEGKRNVIG